ncbi:MAG: spheroidene monooxygenase [Chitinophagaceae bacterium]
MTVSLTIIRYRKAFIFFAILSMALFRLPLWMNRQISFWKLMGSGKNGSFDKTPDWQQWAILVVHRSDMSRSSFHELYGSFIAKWIKMLGCETWTVIMEPIEGHGTWDGEKAFGALPPKSNYAGMIGILTRATIRVSKLKAFWSNVPAVSNKMSGATGLICSLGIGEIPLIKQATFSVWESKEAMQQFAYQMKEHAEVVRKTRQENWYSEEMFTRFRIIHESGTIKGINPLDGKL